MQANSACWVLQGVSPHQQDDENGNLQHGACMLRATFGNWLRAQERKRSSFLHRLMQPWYCTATILLKFWSNAIKRSSCMVGVEMRFCFDLSWRCSTSSACAGIWNHFKCREDSQHMFAEAARTAKCPATIVDVPVMSQINWFLTMDEQERGCFIHFEAGAFTTLTDFKEVHEHRYFVHDGCLQMQLQQKWLPII